MAAGLSSVCGYLACLEPGQVREGLSLVAWIWIPAWVRAGGGMDAVTREDHGLN